MIPAAFDYVRASSPEEAVALLAAGGEDAKLLAGGHSLLPLMKLRLAAPTLLVDLGELRDLSYVRDEGHSVAVGALTRHADVNTSGLLRQESPLLAATAGQVGDPQVRHRGTIGGSVAHGDPASDLPAALLALRATVIALGPSGRREIAIDDFFTGFLETALDPDEMVVEIKVPKTANAGWSFQKFTRRAQDWAIVGVACVTGQRPGLALVNMGPTPLRATAVEDALAAGASVDRASATATDGTAPSDDLHGTAEYRRHLARVLVRRALQEASARAS